MRTSCSTKTSRRFLRIARRSIGTPTNLAALVKAGDVLRKTDLPAALQLYRRAVTQHPKSAWAHIALGDALRQNKDLAGGKEQYLAAVACDPNSPWARRQLGYVEFELGEYEKAEEHLAPLAIDGDADVWEVMGHLARRRGALDESIRWYERARAAAPDRARLLVALADALMAQGDLPRAEATARQANTLDPAVGPAWVLLGDIVRRRANGEQAPLADELRSHARLAYERALRLNASDLRAARQLGTLAYELNDDTTALDLLSRARPAFADDGELSLVIGHAALRQRSFAAARRAYLEATGQLPNDVRPWVFAGRATLQLSKYDEAEQLFSHAIELDPQSGWAHLERGYGQRARRDWQAALHSAEAATRFAPRNPQAWLFLGRLHQEKNRADEAIAAYEQARLLAANEDPQIDRALASALTHKGQVEGLVHAETLMALPLKVLGDEGYTHAIAGYLFVKLALVSELSLPTPPLGVSPKQRRDQWVTHAITQLKEAVRLTPDDRHLRLAAAVGLSELEQLSAASEVLAPLLHVDAARCPAREEDFSFDALAAAEPPPPAKTPEQALALELHQLLSEAQLLAGDLAARTSAAQARLRYFCSLAFTPSRADAHLRLGASYEAAGLTRLAEEHFLAAHAVDPNNRIARESVARLNKEGGIPIGPVGLSGVAWFSSSLVPGDVQARLAQSTGAVSPDARRAFLATPRGVGIEAETSWQRPQWGSRLRFGLGYSFSYHLNTLLNDQLTFEDRVSNQLTIIAQGRPRLFDDGRFDALWRARYRLIFANAQSRSELRNGLELEGRLLRDGWGTLSADVLYSFGLFRPAENATITDPTAHNVSFGVTVSPLIRRYPNRAQRGVAKRACDSATLGRTVWVNQLRLDGLRRFGPMFGGAEVRLGQSSDSQGADPRGTLAFSVMPRALAGFRWNGYTSVVGRTGVSIVPGNSTFDSFSRRSAGRAPFRLQRPRLCGPRPATRGFLRLQIHVATAAP
jgi:tetratricopeptide (TPR) repeat protein